MPQRGAPQPTVTDDREESSLKPTLGSNTHVLTLAHLTALERDADATTRSPKRSPLAVPTASVQPTAASTKQSSTQRSPTGPVKAPSSSGVDTPPKPTKGQLSPTPVPTQSPSPAHTKTLKPLSAAATNTAANTSLSASFPGGPSTRSTARALAGRTLSPLSKSAQQRATAALVTQSTHARSASAPPRQPLSPTTSSSPRPLRKADFTTLLTAVRPLPMFQAQVRRLRRLDNMDISWLTTLPHGGGPPSSYLSLANLNDSLLLKDQPGSTPPVLLNSPRSVLACLRTGIGPMEIQRRPLTSFAIDGSVVTTSEDILRRRQEFYEARRAAKVQTLQEEYAAICRLIDTNDLMNFFRTYDATHPATALQAILPFEGADGAKDYTQGIEQDMQTQRERSQKMLEARRREIDKRLRHTQELQSALQRALEERKVFEERVRLAQEEDRRQREAKTEQQRQRQQEWKQHLEALEAEHSEQMVKRQALMAEKEHLRAQLLAENQGKKRLELEEKAARNTERLQVNKEKLANLQEQRRLRLEEKSNTAEQKRLQMEEGRAKEREALQLKAQQVAAHQEQIQMEAQRRLEAKQLEQERRQVQAEERLREFWQVQDKKREEKRLLEQKKEEARLQVVHAAKEEEERRRQHALAKQAKQDEAYQQKLRAEAAANMIAAEDTALARAAKADFVERQQRVQAFEQLRTIDELQRKADRVRNTELRKQRILEERRDASRRMEVEKERMLTEAQRQFDTLAARS